MHRQTNKSGSFHSIFHVSSHAVVCHQNTNPLATKFRKTAPTSDTLASVYCVTTLVCIHCSGFHLVFSCFTLYPWGCLIHSCKLSFAFKAISVIFYRRFLNHFQWKYLQVIQFITFQEMEVKTFNLQKGFNYVKLEPLSAGTDIENFFKCACYQLKRATQLTCY